MTDEKVIRKYRKRLEKALEKDDLAAAVETLLALERVDPTAPRWPHKRGDLLRKQGNKKDAVSAYTSAVDLYADEGFLARAIAMAKTVLNLDPKRIDVLQRVDPEAARMLHRQQRPAGASMAPPGGADEGGGHPAILDNPAMANTVIQQHPMIIDDGGSLGAPESHPMIIDDGGAADAGAFAAPDEPPAPTAHPMILDDAPPLPAAPPQRKLKKRPPSLALDDPAQPTKKGKKKRVKKKKKPNPLSMELDVPSRMDVSGNTMEMSVPPEVLAQDANPPAIPGAGGAALDLGGNVLDGLDALVVAPDVGPSETRFSDAPPRPSIDLDMSDLEISPRRDPSVYPEPLSAVDFSQLPLFPLFAEVPKAALDQLVNGAQLLELEDGAMVTRKGDAADALFGIVEGGVRVLVPGQLLKLTLAEGDVFGESCLLSGEKRHADVVVQGHATVLKIPRATLNEMLKIHPGLAEVLLELLTRRLLGNLLQTSPLFAEFDAGGRRTLARGFEIRRAPKGVDLAEPAKRMDGLYITLTGEIEVDWGGGAVPKVMGAGHMFGHNNLLTNEPSRIGIKTMSNMIVLRMPAEALKDIVMQYPSMLSTLSEFSSADVTRVTA